MIIDDDIHRRECRLFFALLSRGVSYESKRILDANDLYRVEHRLVFQAILRLYSKRLPIDYLAVEEELRKGGDFGKIDHRYLLSLIELSDVLIDEAERGEKSFNEIIAYAENQLSNRSRSTLPSKSLQPADYFAHQLKADIDQQNVAPLSPRYFLKFCWQ